MNPKIRIPVVFIDPVIGDLGGPSRSTKIIEDEKAVFLNALRLSYPHVEFLSYDIREPVDVQAFLNVEGNAVGYVVVTLNSLMGFIDPIIRSGKPVVVISEAYAGAGEYMLGVSKALSEGYPVIGVSTRNLASQAAINKVRYLVALARLRMSKVLFIVSPSLKSHLYWQFGPNTDMYSVFRLIQSITGVTPVLMDANEFRTRFFDRVSDDEADEWTNRWVKYAEAVYDDTMDETRNSAKLYVAMRNAVRELGVSAVAVDCIVLYNTGLLRAWPCLGYMQLWYDGIIPICEADPYAAVPILIAKYLLNRNGFVVNVGVDEERSEFIYHHYYAPTNPHGSDRPEVPYVITKAHLGTKHASVHVKLPTNEPVTVVGFNPEERLLTIHVSKAVNNEYAPQACATKLIGSGNVTNVVRNWRWRSGWHRVVIYGDFRRELEEFARLLELKVLHEDL
ncbi:L-fucose isomerase and related protein-like protein [Vulcanisaeta moutnovskia 768-28]|uniref:L-fucose isomerase and related protein-like protein n=1 Tax=Vulcanisaeta moutnovskia (strain 768-28) TaxID=985053 RepID=F0QX75_VULM7|nr:fucose isomerase [Vulcanisaeta moutnovskia]ADY02364.1 L-fucose isomerase and related protein-like protein [Vulcanisaeta moutnovskia 768-28]